MSGGAGFGAASAWKTMAAACEATGLDGGGAELMRLGENALFHLPACGVVVRIARTMAYWDDAQKEVDVAHWLAGQHFPAAETADVSQPIKAGEHPVTFWTFITGHPAERQDVAQLGAVLRKLHHTPPPETFTLPPEDILGRVRPRIESAPIEDADREFLLSRLEDLKAQVNGLRYPLDPAPTHGDAHIGNLMIDGDRTILIDFERFAWGQPEWDLAMTATEHVTADWWTDEEYGRFTEAYGYDVTAWDGFDVLRAVHEIKMTTWLMQNVNESPEVAQEYRLRMRTLRGEDSPGWRPF